MVYESAHMRLPISGHNFSESYNVGPDGLKEMKPKVGSKKRKRINNKKRKLSEGDGVHVGAVALVNMKTEEDRSSERKGGNHDQASAHGLQEMKVEIESRKKKSRPKKKSESEPITLLRNWRSIVFKKRAKLMKKELNVKGDSASDNIVEKLESSLLYKADNHNADQN
ncbi:hypothetical protein EZV62_025496 [Acer yangbiense]|uniref:Uncharacterized protein n=1 Tax=Acer yangbiense TaxID=1000413 RepID=A0A5C7GYG6_9ROSI|nr:hypothetical protein EZV62_025496 [Acer yangbiense]